ncbi:MAG TPA: acetyl-CoA carboxylase carboxyltransferase subunit alpha [Mycobacteriales bacterium]|nr:acetyl-CoA carboxylase carboxyltransferase subunit alpha [Mycobacteriales bacterium]
MTHAAGTREAPHAWVRCVRCGTISYRKRFDRALGVCACGWHAPLTAPDRLDQILDPGTWRLLPTARCAEDPLGFVDTVGYPRRLAEARARTGLDQAVLCAQGTVRGSPVVVAAMDFRFLGGSLGCSEGEAIARAAERSRRERVPLLMVTASGGARMQEGVLSLMQMAKASQALAELDEAGVLTVSLITDPTYGGVAASFATLADVVLAEPGARLGFAGPRVIEQTIRQPLPEGFQTAELLLRQGLIDDVQPRSRLRPLLGALLRVRRPDPESPSDRHDRHDQPPDRDGQPSDRDGGARPDAWQTVRLARHTDRPTALEHIAAMIDGFQELHGDRASGDCPAVVGGIGELAGRTVVIIGHQKGHHSRELAARNFGMATPEGYRKAARLMRLAGKLRIPVVTLIDTPGAYPGREAEERGQAQAIAENLRLMACLPVPIVAVVTGEGGSGGALALAVADRVLACAGAIYSVISPEGCAAIVWKDTAAAPLAASALRLDAATLLDLGVLDAVVPEPAGGAHRDPTGASALVRAAVMRALGELAGLPAADLVAARRRRFRSFGLPPDRADPPDPADPVDQADPAEQVEPAGQDAALTAAETVTR